MRKHILLLLSALFGAIAPAFAFSFYDASTGQTLYYNINSDNTTVTVTHPSSNVFSPWIDYTKPTGHLTIPSSVTYGDNTYTVTSIGNNAFLSCSGITSLSIPNSVTTIGKYAFQGCSGITALTIPNSVITIGYAAFQDCSGITSLIIGESVNTIGEFAFQNCSGITSLTIPNSVITIGHAAFQDCSGITSLTIGESVTTIGEYAFQNCSGITSVSIPDSVTTIGEYAFQNCSGITSLTIPNSITTIGEFAFQNCSGITSLTIPNSITTIDGFAFSGCSSLSSLTIPNSVTTIGYAAFNDCSGITSLIIGESVTTISAEAFSGCSSLTSLTIPNSVTSIECWAFYGCSSLTSITLSCTTPPSLETCTFDGVPTNLPIYVPCYAVDDYREASDWINLNIQKNPNCHPVYYTIIDSENHYLNASNSSSGSTFSIDTDTWPDLEIPESVEYNGQTYFVTTIGYEAFLNCGGITSVTIPNSVTTIGADAFRNCSGLTSITISNSVTSIGNYAFNGCRGLTSLVVPNSVTSIGNHTFDGCSGLTSITIPNSVTFIGHYAFFGCSNLTSITIPNSVTSINSYTFWSCGRLSSVTIGESVASIGEYAFNNCSNLKTVYNLSELPITKGNSDYGRVSINANRVITPTKHGSGKNTLYQIPETYTFVDAEDEEEAHIPRSTLPNIPNLIYRDTTWKAKEVILTDCQDAFSAPVSFTAANATYTREFTDAHRSTLYLPFTVAIPNGFEVYQFASFFDNTLHFTVQEDSIAAYTPYLVGYGLSKADATPCTLTASNAVFPKSEPTNYHPVISNNMTFQGVLERTTMSGTNYYGYSNGFFVQSGGNAHVNPFRCFFIYNNGFNPLPPMVGVDIDDGYAGIVQPDQQDRPSVKFYSNDVYDMMGRKVRQNADNLDGLPKGIYIWRGKKVLAY